MKFLGQQSQANDVEQFKSSEKPKKAKSCDNLLGVTRCACSCLQKLQIRAGFVLPSD
jgi:hypothetical protein